MLLGEAGATVATSRHASLWLDDGSGGSPRPTVSLWQLNLQSLRADRWFQIAFRRDAVVWAAVSGSP
jgi:hypothetical protein